MYLAKKTIALLDAKSLYCMQLSAESHVRFNISNNYPFAFFDAN